MYYVTNLKLKQMKTKKMLLYCCAVFMFTACGEDATSETEQLEKENAQHFMDQVADISDERIVEVLSNKTENYNVYKFKKTASTFNVDSDYLFLDIPVADTNLKIMSVENISSKNANAILVWLKNPDGGFANKKKAVKGLLQKRFSISDLDLDKKMLRTHKKIKVFFWNNDTLTNENRKKFKSRAGKFGVYDEDDCDDFGPNKEPDEYCGDILTGG